ncbi:MAG: choline dehydrogenase [Xanthomonadales bacterium]|nr:choline dehydrogenase [Xanthomonadales bacterium]
MYDYVIVGAGSAGCVLAARLSEDPAVRVLLLEAGGRDWHPFIHMPAGLARLVGRKGINWDYYTEPEPALAGRRLWWPRGKVLGGSSSINAMCYVRGHPADYDEWAALGCPGWSFAEVLPFFRRAERNARGADDYHGADGPLSVEDLRYVNPLSQLAVEAAVAAGLGRCADFNGPSQEGFGLYQVTQRAGRRASTARAYLAPARSRPNLVVLTRALAERIELSRGRATAVIYRRFGRRHRVEAEREILLAAGAVNSPQLLMLSGIGPAEELRRHGIGVEVDAPEVGANLQDHLDVCVLRRCTQRITYDRVSDVALALEYLLTRRGIGTSNIAESGGFVRSPFAPDARPDLQFHFVPAMLDDHGRHRLPGDGFTLHVCGLRPLSRGRIALAGADPRLPPRIFANYLSDPEGRDLRVLLEGVRIAREILAQAPLRPFAGAEIFPGAEVRDEAGLVEFIRRKAETIYHPVGTCRMGSDASAVLDPELRVRGVEGLRVVDASVMPRLVGGNTNAPVIMIAERAAALIRGRR